MNALVSVIIPVYNTAEFLDKCLLSVTNQSYAHLEIIIVNDGSTDKSGFICQKYADIDSRINYIFKKNGGLSSARNAGIKMAKGEFISFIDSDDYIDKDFIKILIDSCLSNDVLIAMCGRKIVTEKIEKDFFVLPNKQLWSSQEAVERLLTWNNIDGSVCDKLFHRSLFKIRRFPNGRISEDLPVLVSSIIDSIAITHVGKPLYYYYQRNNSITKSIFTKNKITILDSSREVQTMVKKNYPRLKQKADFYYFHHLLYLKEILIGKEQEYKTESKIVTLEIKKNFSKILLNPYITHKRKIKLLLISLNLLGFLQKQNNY